MIFKIFVLAVVLTGPFDPPVVLPALLDTAYISAAACEQARGGAEIKKGMADLRTSMLKKFAKSSISISTKCVDTAEKSASEGK